jgi:hypoxanthine-DNA glycosylase
LWDVLQSCIRRGSLDARIESDSHAANDFQAFFRTHPKITRIFFNGAKAEECFKRHELKKFAGSAVSCMRLPSTSPANASLSFAQKLDAWREILRPSPSG